MTRADYKKVIHDFVESQGSPWDWDDFISISSKDNTLNALKKYCSNVQILYAAEHTSGEYCNSEGALKLIEAANAYGESDEVFENWLNQQQNGGLIM